MCSFKEESHCKLVEEVRLVRFWFGKPAYRPYDLVELEATAPPADMHENALFNRLVLAHLLALRRLIRAIKKAPPAELVALFAELWKG